MNGTNKIIFNTIILYSKIIVCMAISLWTVPLVLKALGTNDFGLYNLVAGVVAMLAFLNGAMTVSTQRYLSVTIGEGDKDKLLDIYNLSLILHILLGLLVVILVEMFIPLLIDHFLKIDAERQHTAYLLFHYLVISMFFTIVAVPFDAVLNAYENMLAFSVVGVIESLLRLAIAFALPFIMSDKLNFYGYSIMFVAVIIFVIKFVYTHYKYRNLVISLNHIKNRKLFFELAGFAGWNALASIAIVGRNQGIAMVLNHFFGTVINAAYGIGNQVNGVLGYFSQTIQKSVNPQLMESHGVHDDDKLERMTFGLTKFSTLSIGIIAIPLFVEMPFVLKTWLHNVPDYTVTFTRLIIVLSILFQLSSGIMSAIQSTGKIKWYTITVCVLMLSILPISYGALVGGASANIALEVACLMEIAAFALRLFFAHQLVSVSIRRYLTNIIMPLVIVHVVTMLCASLTTIVMEESIIRLFVTTIISVAVFLMLTYTLLLSSPERVKVVEIGRKIICRK